MFLNVFLGAGFGLIAVAGVVVLWLWRYRPDKHRQYMDWRAKNRQAVRDAGASVVRTIRDKVTGPQGP